MPELEVLFTFLIESLVPCDTARDRRAACLIPSFMVRLEIGKINETAELCMVCFVVSGFVKCLYHWLLVVLLS